MIEGWIFSIGGILGYLTMLAHSLIYREKILTIFVFVFGWISSFVMEYYIINELSQYIYQNVPLTILEIPLVIPCGWVVTFYGLYSIAEDLVLSEKSRIILAGFLAMLFGLGIETLARNSEFWTFFFDPPTVFTIPVNVILAWGFSVMIFSTGLVFAKAKNSSIYQIIILTAAITTMNILLAHLLAG